MVLSKDCKRFCSYAFYDPEGIVDDYVLVFLKELKKEIDTIVFISNGQVDPNGKCKVEQLGIQVWERENVGFDIEGHKYVLQNYGYDKLREYDEIIMTNSTIAGPLYPLSEMFNSMGERDVDFWGITMHHGENYDPWNLIEYGYIPPHVQSFFIAIRKSMFDTNVFRNYWNQLRPIRSYFEAVGFHEVVFTKKFADMGYKWDVYIDSSELDHISSYPLSYTPREVIVDKRCPIFKRKSLFLSFDDVKAFSYGEVGDDLLECLKERHYDVNLLLPNVLRTTPLLQVNVALSTLYVNNEDTTSVRDQQSICIFVYIWDEYCCEIVRRYIKELADAGDVYVYTKISLEQLKDITQYTNVTISESSLGKETYGNTLEIAKRYEYACYLTFDVEIPEEARVLPKLEYYRYSMDSLCKTKELLYNHIQTLKSISYLGMLSPGICANELYNKIQYGNWSSQYDITQEVLERLNVAVSLKQELPPYAPYAGFYLVRVEDIIDMPLQEAYGYLEEMNCKDVLKILHMIIPCMLQKKGKVSGYALSEYTARGNLVLESAPSIELLDRIENIPYRTTLFYDIGDGICEKDSIVKKQYIKQKDSMIVIYELPCDTKQLRIDPQECYYFMGLKSKICVNGEEVQYDTQNGNVLGEYDYFVTRDPMYLLGGEFHKGDLIQISYDMVYCFGEMNSQSGQEAIRLVNDSVHKQLTQVLREKEHFMEEAQQYHNQVNEILESKSYKFMRGICDVKDRLWK